MNYNNTLTIPYLACFSFALGILTYGWYNYWPAIMRIPRDEITNLAPSRSKNIRITYWSTNEWKHEERTIVWSSSPTDRLTHLIQAWLSIMDEEGLLPHSCNLSSVALSESGLEAFISFDHSPLSPHHGTYINWMFIESLLTSLRENEGSIQWVRFLECHQPLNDNHLDFSKAWPIEGFLQARQPHDTAVSSFAADSLECTLVIDPAGSGGTSERVIDDTFERGITLQYAQALSKALQEKLPHALITVARSPGEAVEPLRNAVIANRLNADLYLNINFYAEKEHIPTCLISFMSWHPMHELVTYSDSLSFTPYNEAYRIHAKQSHMAAQLCQEHLRSYLPMYAPILAGLPCKSLRGIIVPAINIEFGIHTKSGWQALVQPMAQALLPAIHALIKDKKG